MRISCHPRVRVAFAELHAGLGSRDLLQVHFLVPTFAVGVGIRCLVRCAVLHVEGNSGANLKVRLVGLEI